MFLTWYGTRDEESLQSLRNSAQWDSPDCVDRWPTVNLYEGKVNKIK